VKEMRADDHPNNQQVCTERDTRLISFCSLEFEQNVGNIAKHYIQDIQQEKKRRRAIHFD
jgi:chloramphenicol O-acetyltransferase